MNGCVVVQTCDAYAKFWPGFAYSMRKYWDFSIPWPVFFCNEDAEINFTEPGYTQLRTGSGSYIQRLDRILDRLKDFDYVFYMLEDFWPTDRMDRQTFLGLFDIFQTQRWDCLRVSTFMPSYYKATPTDHIFKGRRILKYNKDSDWKFSQQASFWKMDFLRSCLVEPSESEVMHKTSLTAEIACNQRLNQLHPNAEIYHYHYFWYPISGTVWRGELSEIGQQIEVVMNIENMLSSPGGT